jgi:hypothetical protein
MATSSDKSPGEDGKFQPEASLPPADKANDTPPETGAAGPTSGAAADNELPLVEAPNLFGEETVERPESMALIKAPHLSDRPSAAAAPQPRKSRVVLLTLTIALVAALGSFIGSLTASGINRLLPADAPRTHTADVTGVLQATKSQLAELATIKANLDAANRYANAEFAKIADRLDHVERAQADPAKLAHIADAVDRLDKRNAAAPETTGSITPAAPPAGEPKLPERVIGGWTVQDVRGGRALVMGPYGGVYVVGPGGNLPVLGRVETVRRQDGQWVVVTARGVITSER